MDTSQVTSKKTNWTLWAVLTVLVVSAVGAFILGKQLFPENLSPAMRDFRTYLKTTEQLDIDGGSVRRDRTNARYRTIFHLGDREDNHFFFIEEFTDEEGAQKRTVELRNNSMVTPARVTQNRLFVLYISNDWNPEEAIAQKLQQSFKHWSAHPSPETTL